MVAAVPMHYMYLGDNAGKRRNKASLPVGSSTAAFGTREAERAAADAAADALNILQQLVHFERNFVGFAPPLAQHAFGNSCSRPSSGLHLVVRSTSLSTSMGS